MVGKRQDIYIRKLRVPVYNTSLWIVVSPSLIRSIDYVEDLIDIPILKEEDKKSARAFTFGYTNHKGAQRFILFLRPRSKPGEVGHEVKHLINIIFNWNGVKLSTTNDESECYYLETLLDKVHNTVNFYKKKNK